MTGPDRVEAARAEIARRRALAEAATPGPWELDDDGCCVWADDLITERAAKRDATFIVANQPAHVLAVLDAAERTLDHHGPALNGAACRSCLVADGYEMCWTLRDVLDLYAPALSSEGADPTKEGKR